MKKILLSLLIPATVVFGIPLFILIAGNTAAPYSIESTKMPQGNDFSQLIPAKVGTYNRISYKAPQPGLDGEATYRSGKKEIFMLFSLADTRKDVKETFRTIHEEIKDNDASQEKIISIKSNPAYIKFIGPKIAFFAWSRELYCFSADSKNGDKKALDEFMLAFPY
jgi:hypothetical protein